MRAVIAYLMTASYLMLGCTPRYEAWRMDRTDGTSTLLVQKNYSMNTPIIWQMDLRTDLIREPRPVAIAEMDYMGQAQLDYAHIPAPTVESGRYHHLERRRFESFLIDNLSTRPYAQPANPNQPRYTGAISVDGASGTLTFDLQDGGQGPTDLVGTCPYRTLIPHAQIHD